MPKPGDPVRWWQWPIVLPVAVVRVARAAIQRRPVD